MTITTRIEKAYGANLTANPATWIWTDVSNYALGSVTVIAGRGDEASQTQPTKCTFRLKNTDGRFSPRLPSSPHYPNVRRQTPVRISLNPGTGYVQVFQGYVDDITPSWPAGNSEYAEVAVTASGLLRRLQQGNNVLRSAIYRAVTTASTLPTAYWPCEDGSDGLRLSTAVSPIAGVSPMTAVGASNFASTEGAPGSDVQPDFTAGGSLTGQVPGSGAVTSWRVQVAWKANTIPASDFAIPLQWTTADGHAWEIDLNPGALVFSEDLAFTSPSVAVAVDNGIWHEGRVDAVQSGGNINITVYFDGVSVITESIAGTVSRVVTVEANAAGGPSSILSGIGQFIVWNGSTTVAGLDTVDSMHGHASETAGARIARLCNEQGVPVSVSSTTGTASMGPQRIATLLTLLRECETADGGILYDGQSAGLNYLARIDRYNLPVSMALDTKRQQVKLPFAPVEDDQRIRNDVTVTRRNGSSARYVDQAHAAANGLYDTSVALNLADDSQLANVAAWLVHLGTVEEMRIPGLTLELIDHPELWPQWLATAVGSRITVANPPAQYPPGLIDQIVEGYTETWDATSWRIEPNLSPYAPWAVAVVTDTRYRVGSNQSTTSGAVAAGATSMTVVGHAWSTGTPYDVRAGGWKVHVTNVSGTTFTIDPAPGAIPNGSAVTMWTPATVALA